MLSPGRAGEFVGSPPQQQQSPPPPPPQIGGNSSPYYHHGITYAHVSTKIYTRVRPSRRALSQWTILGIVLDENDFQFSICLLGCPMPMLTYPTKLKMKLVREKNLFWYVPKIYLILKHLSLDIFCQVQILKFQRVYSYGGSSVDIFGNLSRHSRTSRPFFIFIPSTTNIHILCSIDRWVDQSQN